MLTWRLAFAFAALSAFAADEWKVLDPGPAAAC